MLDLGTFPQNYYTIEIIICSLANQIDFIISCIVDSHSNLFKELKQKFSKVYAIDFPDSFVSVSEFYENFDQVEDETVFDILANY